MVELYGRSARRLRFGPQRMPDPPVKRLTTRELADVLNRLDEVMAEATRLRREITKQMTDHRRDQQQKLSPPARRHR